MFLSDYPGATLWSLASDSSPTELNLQLTLQLHNKLKALNVFLNSCVKLGIHILILVLIMHYEPRVWSHCSTDNPSVRQAFLPLCVQTLYLLVLAVSRCPDCSGVSVFQSAYSKFSWFLRLLQAYRNWTSYFVLLELVSFKSSGLSLLKAGI